MSVSLMLNEQKGIIMETISLMDFRGIVGWDCSNHPYSVSSLSYSNDLSGAQIKGKKIGESQYNFYYKYNVIKGTVLFPIIITKHDDKSDKCFIAKSMEELVGFVENPIFDKPFCIKAEKMVGCDYKEIRSHEISISRRIAFHELYSFSRSEFYGYEYVEF